MLKKINAQALMTFTIGFLAAAVSYADVVTVPADRIADFKYRAIVKITEEDFKCRFFGNGEVKMPLPKTETVVEILTRDMPTAVFISEDQSLIKYEMTINPTLKANILIVSTPDKQGMASFRYYLSEERKSLGGDNFNPVTIRTFVRNGKEAICEPTEERGGILNSLVPR